MGLKYVCMKTDEGGIIPSSLREMLSSWSSGPRPRVLYTIPTGSNPAGVSLSEERRDQLYEIACEFDLLILEDDPYYYLQFGTKRKSLFARDVDQRVLRFDSFSKILSAGTRIGVVSGPAPLVEKIVF